MSAPGQQPYINCPHRRTRDAPPYQACSRCWSSLALGPMSSSQYEQARMRQYLMDPSAQAQGRQLQQALGIQGSSTATQTGVNGGAAGNGMGANGTPNDLPGTYPYPPGITELDNIGANVTNPGPVARQHAPNRPPLAQAYRPAQNLRRVSGSSAQAAQRGGSGSQTQTIQMSNNYQRAPLRSITNTSAHNARNSNEAVNGSNSDGDDGEDSEEEGDDIN